ncbi:MAG: precorrin-3B C(17)-methyltransferase [Omnitrophica bacterium RIFCSPLOWO2_02_FULL_45_16]|nr:MAG: precorrin-3B C(17)-methyltransferase [Omnitrophica bacterium RIFCSPHIGHO2_02_FULL_46_20]OGW93798.1 MAG: precorrin-3B C(17)-methyltransferase [Omnitrophica bacterium RIFCSPLOWO2_01_FULL_45_24]OGW94154.1 MAG: precorrin-3B C(17)-methyltransferase [Omnitrophica bacterium RIFCSPLOWO2_12_FULL_45_13]OGX00912.1 MAG: precorrin-3B C(17)-methyltransferase [Omnitrophica bacterium RIFCSPLOWO2_02_FULL_45_16]
MVGIGPGEIGHMSLRARKAIEECQVIVGYNTYIKLLGDLIYNKEIKSFGMTEEIKRAEYAIGRARNGKRVCVISSGDPGVYGMAGLILELLKKNDPNELKIEIIPGVIAAAACASLLGAPLMHDFAVISLSDLLTDLELIERRVESAAKADFVVVLYNPKSARRVIPFQKACDIMLKYRSLNTPVGIVRNAYRDDQEVTVTTLKDLPSFKKINMATTIIIGNSKTYVKHGCIITPRGYNLKQKKGSGRE